MKLKLILKILYKNTKEFNAVGNNENIGGVELKHVITFQTQLMMGAQFGRIIEAKKKAKEEGAKDEIRDELLVACLRMGWNDAFRHTSENVANLEEEIKKHNKDSKAEYDDYFCTILKNDDLLTIFHNYACDESKADYLVSKCNELDEIIGKVKLTNGNHALCFGHYQKMFNIALKLYLCLYLCRDFLELGLELFYGDIIKALNYADCPVDSIILNRIDEKAGIGLEEYKSYNNNKYRNKKFSSVVWSKIGKAENSTIESYKNIQAAVKMLNNDDNKSNLYFDFAEWKNNE